jgi:hypothetical protein
MLPGFFFFKKTKQKLLCIESSYCFNSNYTIKKNKYGKIALQNDNSTVYLNLTLE